MTPGDTIGRNVRRIRESRSMSANELARRVHVRVNTIQQIEKGKTQKSKHLPDIARILEVALSDIDPSQSSNQPGRALPKRELVGDRDLPVYGTTEGGDGIQVMSSEPVDKADRPPSLTFVRDAYGVIVTGDSMTPALRPGDIAVVHPHIQPRREDLCVFRSNNHGEFRSTVKEFVSFVKEGWRVKRYKPEEKEFTLKKSDWDECHVVVTIHRR